MNIFFKIVIFMVMFNIAAFMIASTGFFPNTIYGDTFEYVDDVNLDDPDNLETPDDMIEQIILNAGEKIVIVGVEITYDIILASIITITIILGAITRQTTPITLGLIATMFFFMYINSKRAFDQILDNMDSHAGYVGLMLGLGILILVVIVIMDYAAGQKNA